MFVSSAGQTQAPTALLHVDRDDLTDGDVTTKHPDDQVAGDPSTRPTPAPGPTQWPTVPSQPTTGLLSPSPQASPTAPTAPTEVEPAWTQEDRSKVDAYINDALSRHHGDVAAAFADLRDRRQQSANYDDTNLAIAADYLRARWETQRCGPVVATAEVESYMTLKRTVGVPQEGPGPVSPYSQLELDYMRKGVSDQTDKMSWLEKAWWSSPPGVAFGIARAAWGVLRGEEGKREG